MNVLRTAVSVLLSALLLLTGVAHPVLSAEAAPPKPFSGGKHRVFGADRYETSAKLSARSYAPSAEAAVIVNGLSFADALGAAPLAAKLEAPLLLTSKDTIPAATLKELQRLKPKTIIVVGGSGVVSKNQVESLKKLSGSVKRLSGKDRYETVNRVVEYGWPDGSAHVVVATGADFPDALTASPVASKLGAPILLVPKDAGTTTSEAAKLITNLSVSTVHVAGGTGVVSKTVEKQLVPTNAKAKRYAGKDRFETSALLLSAHFGKGTPTLYMANGMNFPDALAAAAVAGAEGSALTLSLSACTPDVSIAEVKRISPKAIVALGGKSVVSDASLDLQRCGSGFSRGYDIASASSIQVVVNKKRPLSPKTYVPGNLRYPNVDYSNRHMLRGEAATALESMFAAARRAGHSLYLSSGYRDYDLQHSLYYGYINSYGQKWADEQSARPGHSEHQTGLTADIFDRNSCSGACFGSSAAGIWLRNNAHNYGFILRYEDGMQHIVGYTYEPWHFRFVGVEVANDYKKSGLRSLEQFFGLPAAPTY